MFTDEEFADYVSSDIEDIDSGLVSSLKREASVMIRRIGKNLPADTDEWPEAAKVVGLRVVARGYDRKLSEIPPGLESISHTGGPFSQNMNFGNSSGAVLWLSKEDRLLLGAGGGAYTVGLMPRRADGSPDAWSSDTWR